MSDIESELRAVHRDAVSATEQSVEVAELRVRVAELEDLCDDKDKTKATILAGAGGQIDELRAKVGELEQEVRGACETRARILALEAELAQAKDAAKSWKEKAEQGSPLLEAGQRYAEAWGRGDDRGVHDAWLTLGMASRLLFAKQKLPVLVLCACIARSDLDTADPDCILCKGKGEHEAGVF